MGFNLSSFAESLSAIEDFVCLSKKDHAWCVVTFQVRYRKLIVRIPSLSHYMTGTYLNKTAILPFPPSPRLLMFQFLIPSIQIILFCLCIGRTPTDLPLAVYNSETPVLYSQTYLQAVNNNTIHQVRNPCTLQTNLPTDS